MDSRQCYEGLCGIYPALLRKTLVNPERTNWTAFTALQTYSTILRAFHTGIDKRLRRCLDQHQLWSRSAQEWCNNTWKTASWKCSSGIYSLALVICEQNFTEITQCFHDLCSWFAACCLKLSTPESQSYPISCWMALERQCANFRDDLGHNL